MRSLPNQGYYPVCPPRSWLVREPTPPPRPHRVMPRCQEAPILDKLEATDVGCCMSLHAQAGPRLIPGSSGVRLTVDEMGTRENVVGPMADESLI